MVQEGEGVRGAVVTSRRQEPHWLARAGGQGAASQTFASEYVKCFGKCVPNVVDERAVVARGVGGVPQTICTQ